VTSPLTVEAPGARTAGLQKKFTNPPLLIGGWRLGERDFMNEVEYQIHWLSLTVKREKQSGLDLYENVFRKRFGPLIQLGNGGRGFREIYHSTLEIKLYTTPNNENANYWHLEIPGKACESMTDDNFYVLFNYLEENFKDTYLFKRLDFAFDNLHFSPKQVEDAVIQEKVRTLAKRETLRIWKSPFQKKDDDTLGTSTVEIGSNTSERMITVYDKRGFTRLEFQTRHNRANVVARDLFTSNSVEDWFRISVSHLRDYIDFQTEWWQEFIKGQARANRKISKPRDIAMSNLIQWLHRQVACGLSVVADTLPPEAIDRLIRSGRRRRGDRYDLLLADRDNYYDEKDDRYD